MNIIICIKDFKKERKILSSLQEIKYFSPNGNNKLPEGHPYQKGSYIRECKKNEDSFLMFNYQYLIDSNFNLVDASKLTETIHPNQYVQVDYRGGVIIFSTDVNTVYPDNKNSTIKRKDTILNKLNIYKNRYFADKCVNNRVKNFNQTRSLNDLERNITKDYIGAFSVGKFFNGRYFGDDGKVYNENSLSIEINGISSIGLYRFGEIIAREFEQEVVLVKDFNNNKIFRMLTLSAQTKF
jgi:hypothetical protein